jgi:hypothetical protein
VVTLVDCTAAMSGTRRRTCRRLAIFKEWSAAIFGDWSEDWLLHLYVVTLAEWEAVMSGTSRRASRWLAMFKELSAAISWDWSAAMFEIRSEDRLVYMWLATLADWLEVMSRDRSGD